MPAVRIANDPGPLTSAGDMKEGEEKSTVVLLNGAPAMVSGRVGSVLGRHDSRRRKSINRISQEVGRTVRRMSWSSKDMKPQGDTHTAKVGEAWTDVSKNAQMEAIFNQPYVLLPDGTFRVYLDMFSVVFLLYTAVFTPVQISFLSEEMTLDNISEWTAVFVLDRMVDFVFLVDVVVNFRTAWTEPCRGRSKQSELKFEATEAARRYLSGWFAIDFLSLLPYEVLGTIVSSSDTSQFRLPKLLKLFRLFKIAKVLRVKRLMARYQHRITIKFGVLRMLKFLILLIFSAHWMACVWHLVATMAGDNEVTWVRSAALEDTPSSERYLAALYWAVMTLTTIGYGDITAHTSSERAVCSVAMLVAVGLFSYVVGVMCSIIQSIDMANLEFEAQMDTLNDYLSKVSLPGDARNRMRAFMFYRRQAHTTVLEADLLALFSPGIQSEVALYNYQELLLSIPQFASAPPEFISEVGMP